MIIYPPALVLSVSTPLTKPRIGWQTHTRTAVIGDITVSTEAADGPRDAPLRPDTFEYWLPTAMPATWTINLGATEGCGLRRDSIPSVRLPRCHRSHRHQSGRIGLDAVRERCATFGRRTVAVPGRAALGALRQGHAHRRYVSAHRGDLHRRHSRDGEGSYRRIQANPARAAIDAEAINVARRAVPRPEFPAQRHRDGRELHSASSSLGASVL
jgi:hypothetical protein